MTKGQMGKPSTGMDLPNAGDAFTSQQRPDHNLKFILLRSKVIQWIGTLW